MEANEFFKKVGVEAVKSYIAAYDDHLTDELKRLVESWELVEKHGGIDSLNDLFYVHGMNSARVMKVNNLTYADAMQAIADVESCQ